MVTTKNPNVCVDLVFMVTDVRKEAPVVAWDV